MKVIVAIDDSPYSKKVIDSILRRHWPTPVEFKLLTVLEPLCIGQEEFAPDDFSDALTNIHQRRQQIAQRLCDQARHRLESAVPAAKVQCEVREGVARSEIVKAAEDWHADKILVGAHGKDVCPHNLLGSVSRSVASQAPCSVEIVRPQLQHAL